MVRSISIGSIAGIGPTVAGLNDCILTRVGSFRPDLFANAAIALFYIASLLLPRRVKLLIKIVSFLLSGE